MGGKLFFDGRVGLCSACNCVTLLITRAKAVRKVRVLPHPLRIGTRGSPMALQQTALVAGALAAAHPALAAPGTIEIVTIRTTGDGIQHRLLGEIGGKGLFAKEIEEALVVGSIDLAVHSLKDLETRLPDGIAIACVLQRDDPRDALLSVQRTSLASLPMGARVGTASLRRRAQLLRRRPDLVIVPIRGNANTRLRKLDAGEVDALVLALCGLERLDAGDRVVEILSRDVMLPAVGQGVLAVECRAADELAYRLVEPLHDAITAVCVGAERAMLAALGGSCRSSIAGLAEFDGSRLMLEGLLLKPNGSDEIRGRCEGGIGDAAALGTELGRELRHQARRGFGLC
jgi:hydroxymethylbilane synthase